LRLTRGRATRRGSRTVDANGPWEHDAPAVARAREQGAVLFGTCLQLAAARILEANGLSEKDVRSINMDAATARAALATKDVDAVISGSDLFSLRDQGVARIIYSTKGDGRLTCNGTLTASSDFIHKYPSLTKRVVKVYVQASKWLAEHQQDASEAFQLWTRSGQRFSDFKEDWQGEVIKEKASPLIDAYLVNRYEGSIADAKRYGLIRNTFDFKPWVDASFLEQVLREQGLSNYWTEQPASAPIPPQVASKQRTHSVSRR
jgi:sulfonate transport system substrate-binding protein